MRPTAAPTDTQLLTSAAEAASTARGGAAYVVDMARRLAPSCARAEPRQRAVASRRGLLSPAARQNSWQVAEVSGAATPYGFQPVRGRADWEPEAGRDELRLYRMQQLGDSDGVLVLAESGFRKKGRHAAGVARQYSGTAGCIENGPIGVFLAYARQLGDAWLDRELSLPKEWTDDRERGRRAGIPDARHLATKPQLARQMLARALAAGVPATWVTGDSVYGDDRRLRLGLEAQPQADMVAVSGKE
jgi:SRSO17 transposase